MKARVWGARRVALASMLGALVFRVLGVLGALAAFGAFGAVSRALADDRPIAPGSGEGAAERHRVVLIVAASAEDAASLDASLRELLTRIGARLEVKRVERLDLENPASFDRLETDGTALAVVWLDLRTPGEATAAIADGHTGRVLLRRRIERRGSPAIAVETIAHVVQSVVEELHGSAQSAAADAGAPPDAAPDALPIPIPAPAPVIVVAPELAPPRRDSEIPKESEKGRFGLDFGGFFGGHLFGGGSNLVLGGGGTAALRGRPGPYRPALWFVGEYHVAFDVPADLVSVHSQVLSLRLIPAIQIAGGRSWILETGFGGGADVFFTSTRSNDLVRLASPRTDVSPVLTAMVAGHFAVGSTTDLVLALTLDGDLAPHHYVTDEAGQHEAVFAPWRFRPALIFGFTFAALGPAPYPALAGASR